MLPFGPEWKKPDDGVAALMFEANVNIGESVIAALGTVTQMTCMLSVSAFCF